MNVLWVVQSNLGNSDALAAMVAAFHALNIPHRTVQVIPFSSDVPDIDWPGPVLFYGATNFIANVARSRRYHPGVFFSEERFRVSAWGPAYGDHLLNREAEGTTLEKFAAQQHAADDLFFIRPDRDLKAFAGEVVRFGDFQSWVDRISHGGFTLSQDEPIVVAEPQHIRREWRAFLVSGKTVAASQYRVSFRLTVNPETPDEVLAFAEARARDYSPAPVFVLDVADTQAGLRVIEVNCFHSAGFYAANVESIVRAVTRLAQESGPWA